ncbi:MAG: winged helix-turn-helix domain-containing protein [Gammaproteobacteria bacterium]|nr:winged helix-turn-helix domain-containing protein [Gammaproteobacteria bacterium]
MQRFCHFLLMQYQLQKLPAFKIVLNSNQDIASILATSKETISRCITDLREQGVLNRVEKRLYELDLDATEVFTNN